jgi:ABC-type lipoprotein release transport system permease subunit
MKLLFSRLWRVIHNTHHLTVLAARDTLRPVGSLVGTTAILIGILLPLAMLLGLTRGLVKEMLDSLRQSPSGIQIQVWKTNGDAKAFSATVEDELQQGHSAVVLVIPDIHKVATCQNKSSGRELTGIDLRCTKPGDPLLRFYDADSLKPGDGGIVLSKMLADDLGVNYGDGGGTRLMVVPGQQISVTVTRHEGDTVGRAQASLEVRAVADIGNVREGFLDRQLLDSIEDFQQGRAVPELGWPAFAASVPATFQSYLAFCKVPFSSLDHLRLQARGLKSTLLRADDPKDTEERLLGGVLQPHSLAVYRIYADASTTLTLSPREVENITDADDVAVPWSAPRDLVVGTASCRLVGVSLHKRWLARSFKNVDEGYLPNDEEKQIQFCNAASMPGSAKQPDQPVNLLLPTGETASLNPRYCPDQPTLVQWAIPSFLPGMPVILLALPAGLPNSQNPTVLVPAEFLAHLHALDKGNVRYEPSIGRFVLAAQENEYYRARIYVRDVEQVPAVDQYLRQLGYTTQSERTRVEEIQRNAATLDFLVLLVGGTVFLFGLGTLIAVLWDNISRKTGAMGILRIIGIGAGGLFYLVVVRALIIGVFAGALLLPLSWCLGRFMSAHLAFCLLEPRDLGLLFGLALAASVAGVLIPALRFSRMSPGDMIREANAQ